MVITSVCGTENPGSIPGSRPKIESALHIERFVLLRLGFYPVRAADIQLPALDRLFLVAPAIH